MEIIRQEATAHAVTTKRKSRKKKNTINESGEAFLIKCKSSKNKEEVVIVTEHMASMK